MFKCIISIQYSHFNGIYEFFKRHLYFYDKLWHEWINKKEKNVQKIKKMEIFQVKYIWEEKSKKNVFVLLRKTKYNNNIQISYMKNYIYIRMVE